jgi:hypothetical protein
MVGKTRCLKIEYVSNQRYEFVKRKLCEKILIMPGMSGKEPLLIVALDFLLGN